MDMRNRVEAHFALGGRALCELRTYGGSPCPPCALQCGAACGGSCYQPPGVWFLGPPAVPRISAPPHASEPLHSSPFLLLFPMRIVSEVLRTVESALVEGNHRLATSLAWHPQRRKAFVFGDEDGPVPHMNPRSTGWVPGSAMCSQSVRALVFSPDSASFLATVRGDGSVAVPDLAFHRSLKLSPQNPCWEILLGCGTSLL